MLHVLGVLGEECEAEKIFGKIIAENLTKFRARHKSADLRSRKNPIQKKKRNLLQDMVI